MTNLDESIAKYQYDYYKHITLSLTDDCPLRCRHCVVSAGTSKQKLNKTSIDRYLNFVPDIKSISLTGGEPFLCLDTMQYISDYCRSKNIELGVITSAYWAESSEKAKSILGDMKKINKLTISTDEFHLEFVPIDYVINAYKAAVDLGIDVSIKISGTNEDELNNDGKYKKLVDEINDKKKIGFQSLVKMGRASNLNENYFKSKSESIIRMPCLSKSPLMETTGEIKPCCNILGACEKSTILNIDNILNLEHVPFLDKLFGNWILHYIRIWGIYDLVTRFDIIPAKQMQKLEQTYSNCQLCGFVFSNKSFISKIEEKIDNNLKIEIAYAMASILHMDSIFEYVK